MHISDFINNTATGLTGLTVATGALIGAISGWIVLWTRAAKLVPTEWDNKFLQILFKGINMFCRIMAFDWPDIAKIQFCPFRIITRQELTAIKVVAANEVDKNV